MATDQPSPMESRPRRSNRRLRVLLAVCALSFGFYLFVRLDRSVVEPLGPVVEGIYELFNQVPGQAAPLTVAGRRLVKDVKALGGEPSVSVRTPGFLGTLGQTEWANGTFRNLQLEH